MSPLIGRAGLRRFGAILIAIFCIGTAMTLSKPAEARIWVGFNFGYPGYYPGYDYAPAPYYSPAYYPHYGYYRPYWRWHHYRHVHYWRWRHRCHWRWHRCYW